MGIRIPSAGTGFAKIAGIAQRVLRPTDPGAFRLWLALMVVLHHFTRFEFGKAPVLVFFALSGFWIHRVWIARYSKTRHSWLTFVISRWWRLAPVMIVATAVTFAVMMALGDVSLPVVFSQPLRQVFSGVFIVGYGGMPVRPVGPAWSLDIEMQFYLVAPLLAMVVQRTSWILTLLFGYLAFAFGLAFIPGVVLTSFLMFFVIGMAAAQHEWCPSPRVATIGLRVAIIAIIAVLLSPWRQDMLSANGENWQAFNILLAALLLPTALATGERVGDRTDAALGDHSYIIYLLHWPAILVFRHYASSGALGRIAEAAVLMAIVGIISNATWRWIDAPINRIRHRWVSSRRLEDSEVVTLHPESEPVPLMASGDKGGDSGFAFAYARASNQRD